MPHIEKSDGNREEDQLCVCGGGGGGRRGGRLMVGVLDCGLSSQIEALIKVIVLD